MYGVSPSKTARRPEGIVTQTDLTGADPTDDYMVHDLCFHNAGRFLQLAVEMSAGGALDYRSVASDCLRVTGWTVTAPRRGPREKSHLRIAASTAVSSRGVQKLERRLRQVG